MAPDFPDPWPVTKNASILLALALLMTATRIHHVGPVPDASWAVFFLGGLFLRTWTRWAFPALMALAVAIDWLTIRALGLDFWQHCCISAAYWCLIPAHFVLWMGGAWLQGRVHGHGRRGLVRAALALCGTVALCHLLAQGSFYWFSASVPHPTLAGWAANYLQWLGPYLRGAAAYVAAAGLLQQALFRWAAIRRGPPPLAH